MSVDITYLFLSLLRADIRANNMTVNLTVPRQLLSFPAVRQRLTTWRVFLIDVAARSRISIELLHADCRCGSRSS